jgi:hypothetical protein
VPPGWDHPSVYPEIDPKVHYDAQTFANKVVLITGASRGIGAQIALQYARAGASLSLVARTQAALDASKDAILREHPSAQVLTFPADVRDVKKAEEVVAATVAHYGHLDILIANAGALRAMDKRTFGTPPTRIIIADLCRRRKHSPRRIRTDGGISLKSTFVGPITSPSASYILFFVPNAYLIVCCIVLLSLNYWKQKVRWSFSAQACPKLDYQTRASTASQSTQCSVLRSLLPLVSIIVSSSIRIERLMLIAFL